MWNWVRSLPANSAVNQAGWVTGIFLILQVLRLVSNIILAHLLSPAIFGVMALVNSLRTGIELLTDVGIGQNIVVSPEGDKPEFFYTAWTLQVWRGLVLTLIGTVAAWPITWMYGHDSLLPILIVSATIFFVSGLNTPARFLMQRRQEGRKLSLLDALFQTIGMIVSIGFAATMPSVWGMTLSLVVNAALVAAISFLLMDVRLLKFRIEREHLTSILSFGKWIFVSSLIYFAASNYDRLYLPAHIPLALFGVYGIARSLSDLATQLMQRVGGMVVFPAVARAGAALHEQMPRIVRLRSAGLALVSVGIGGGVAISDLFVQFAYDTPYAAAVIILPMLLAGSWFSVQATISESVLLGLSQSKPAALANFAKLMWTVILLPVALAHGNLFLAFLILSVGDIPRYFILLVAQHRGGLRFILHDLGLLLLMLATLASARILMIATGLVDGWLTTLQWSQFHILWTSI